MQIRRAADRVASIGVRAGGITIIISILLILVLISLATVPLWRSPRVQVTARLSAKELLGDHFAEKVMAIGCEEQRQLAYLLTESGVFHIFNLAEGSVVSHLEIPTVSPTHITAVWQSLDGKKLALGTSDGRALIGNIDFAPQYGDDGYSFSPTIDFTTDIQLDTVGKPIRSLTISGDTDETLFVAGITADNRILIYAQEIRQTLFGEGEKTIYRQQLPTPEARPTQIAVNDDRDYLFIGCENGSLVEYSPQNLSRLTFTTVIHASDRPITTLGFLVGGRSLVVGDAAGRTSIYFSILDPDTKSGRRVRRAHQLPALDGPITLQTASARNRTYLAASTSGEVGLFFSTNERVLFQGLLTSAPLAAAIFAPKANGLLLLDEMENIYDVDFYNPHPESNGKAFFQKIWYEGYNRPEYVWQSTGGTDDFEAKLSLVPLVFGTLKGTFYAMLFALPLAVFAALYVSQFMHPSLRNIMKPTVEIMAALPSVVLGFLAGLWLAPIIQNILPALLLMSLVLPLLTIIMSFLRELASQGQWGWRKWVRAGRESFIMLPVLVGGIWLCLQLNGTVEAWLFDGDFKQWLLEVANLQYDQRNAFVVGLAMAFAVIPIIFTISEDALSNVPSSLTAASLALGATPWTTAVRVVLPTASPGIFSAVMIGFGRAVGETMIVLMATGNTPIMDLSMFNGFRTLSANIAVEIPEAPVGGTLFRTLFMAALLLFLMTFVVNTIADVVRQRMRQKYGKL